jgi:hypothetical protein
MSKTVEFPSATISTVDYTMGNTVEFPSATISTVDGYESLGPNEVGQWTDRQIEQDGVGLWIEHLNEVFESSTDFRLLVKGRLTAAATILLRNFFKEKNAFYHKHAGVFVFPGSNSGSRCVRMLGVDHPRVRNDMDPVV